MLVLLPLQFVWGAGAGYCQHEEGAATSHFGHHAHKHEGKTLKQSGQASTAGEVNAGGADSDCGSCHLASVSPLASVSVQLPVGGADRAVTTPWGRLPPLILATIERPNWTLAL